jgi:trans-aconitate 2-methyltransferase
VAAKWASQLEPGGLLLLEETEMIHSAHPAFARYLSIVEAMLAAQSNQLYAGRLLASLNLHPSLSLLTSDLRPLAVRNRDAAGMFLLNLRTWKENEFIRANYSRDSINELERELTAMANNESQSRQIKSEMRQAAWLKE